MYSRLEEVRGISLESDIHFASRDVSSKHTPETRLTLHKRLEEIEHLVAVQNAEAIEEKRRVKLAEINGRIKAILDAYEEDTEKDTFLELLVSDDKRLQSAEAAGLAPATLFDRVKRSVTTNLLEYLGTCETRKEQLEALYNWFEAEKTIPSISQDAIPDKMEAPETAKISLSLVAAEGASDQQKDGDGEEGDAPSQGDAEEAPAAPTPKHFIPPAPPEYESLAALLRDPAFAPVPAPPTLGVSGGEDPDAGEYDPDDDITFGQIEALLHSEHAVPVNDLMQSAHTAKDRLQTIHDNSINLISTLRNSAALQELGDLREENERLGRDTAEKSSRIRMLTDDMSSLVSRLREAESKNSSLSKSVAKKLEEIQELRQNKELFAVREQLSNLQNESAATEERLRARVAELELEALTAKQRDKEINSLKSHIVSLERAGNINRVQMESEVRNTRADLAATQKFESRVRARIHKEFEDQKNRLMAEVNARHQKELRSLNVEHSRALQRVEKDSASAIDAQIKALKAASGSDRFVDQVRKEYEKRGERMRAAHEDRLANMRQSHKEALDSASKDTARMLAQAEHDHAKVIDEYKQKLEKVSEQAEAAEILAAKRLRAKEREYDLLEIELRNLEPEKSDLMDQLSGSTRRANAAEAELEQLREKLTETESRLNRAYASLKDREQTIVEQGNELNAVRESEEGARTSSKASDVLFKAKEAELEALQRDLTQRKVTTERRMRKMTDHYERQIRNLKKALEHAENGGGDGKPVEVEEPPLPGSDDEDDDGEDFTTVNIDGDASASTGANSTGPVGEGEGGSDDESYVPSDPRAAAILTSLRKRVSAYRAMLADALPGRPDSDGSMASSASMASLASMASVTSLASVGAGGGKVESKPSRPGSGASVVSMRSLARATVSAKNLAKRKKRSIRSKVGSAGSGSTTAGVGRSDSRPASAQDGSGSHAGEPESVRLTLFVQTPQDLVHRVDGAAQTDDVAFAEETQEQGEQVLRGGRGSVGGWSGRLSPRRSQGSLWEDDADGPVAKALQGYVSALGRAPPMASKIPEGVRGAMQSVVSAMNISASAGSGGLMGQALLRTLVSLKRGSDMSMDSHLSETPPSVIRQPSTLSVRDSGADSRRGSTTSSSGGLSFFTSGVAPLRKSASARSFLDATSDAGAGGGGGGPSAPASRAASPAMEVTELTEEQGDGMVLSGGNKSLSRQPSSSQRSVGRVSGNLGSAQQAAQTGLHEPTSGTSIVRSSSAGPNPHIIVDAAVDAKLEMQTSGQEASAGGDLTSGAQSDAVRFPSSPVNPAEVGVGAGSKPVKLMGRSASRSSNGGSQQHLPRVSPNGEAPALVLPSEEVKAQLDTLQVHLGSIAENALAEDERLRAEHNKIVRERLETAAKINSLSTLRARIEEAPEDVNSSLRTGSSRLPLSPRSPRASGMLLPSATWSPRGSTKAGGYKVSPNASPRTRAAVAMLGSGGAVGSSPRATPQGRRLELVSWLAAKEMNQHRKLRMLEERGSSLRATRSQNMSAALSTMQASIKSTMDMPCMIITPLTKASSPETPRRPGRAYFLPDSGLEAAHNASSFRYTSVMVAADVDGPVRTVPLGLPVAGVNGPRVARARTASMGATRRSAAVNGTPRRSQTPAVPVRARAVSAGASNRRVVFRFAEHHHQSKWGEASYTIRGQGGVPVGVGGGSGGGGGSVVSGDKKDSGPGGALMRSKSTSTIAQPTTLEMTEVPTDQLRRSVGGTLATPQGSSERLL